MRSKIKLSEIIAAWDILHVKHTGEIGYCDLQNALEEVGVEIENDCADATRRSFLKYKFPNAEGA